MKDELVLLIVLLDSLLCWYAFNIFSHGIRRPKLGSTSTRFVQPVVQMHILRISIHCSESNVGNSLNQILGLGSASESLPPNIIPLRLPKLMLQWGNFKPPKRLAIQWGNNEYERKRLQLGYKAISKPCNGHITPTILIHRCSPIIESSFIITISIYQQITITKPREN